MPQAIKAAIASDHHGVPFSLKKATRKEDVRGLVKGQRADRQTYDKTSNGPHTFFYVPDLGYMEKL